MCLLPYLQVEALVRRVSDPRGVGPHGPTVLLLLVSHLPVLLLINDLLLCPPLALNELFTCPVLLRVGVFDSRSALVHLVIFRTSVFYV